MPVPSPPDPTSPPRCDRIALLASRLALAGLFGYYLIYILLRLQHGHFGDFPTFYHAARAVLAHGDPYAPVEAGLAYVYPPLLATLYTPLTALSKLNAARVMLVVNLLMLLAALRIATHDALDRFDLPKTPALSSTVTCIAALLALSNLRAELQALETDVLMLLLFVLALHWLDRRPVLCGLALAFALNVKYLAVCFLPYLLVRRRWRAAASTLACTVLLALLPALVAGWHDNLRYLAVALGGLLGWVGPAATAVPSAHPTAQPVAHVHHIADLVSGSITSAIARHLRDTGRPESLALVAAAVIVIALLAATALAYRTRRVPALAWPPAARQAAQPFRALVGAEWIGILCLVLAFSPNTNPRHLCMVVFAYVAAVALLLAAKPGIPQWPLLVAIVATFIGLLLPLPNLTGRAFSHRYAVLGCDTWGLVALYAALLYTALSWVGDTAPPPNPPGNRSA